MKGGCVLKYLFLWKGQHFKLGNDMIEDFC